jgi:hypothetical protein
MSNVWVSAPRHVVSPKQKEAPGNIRTNRIAHGQEDRVDEAFDGKDVDASKTTGSVDDSRRDHVDNLSLAVGFGHQRRSLKCLSGLLLCQFGCRQFPQFVVDQRQELFSGERIAIFDLRQDSRDIGHAPIVAGRNRAITGRIFLCERLKLGLRCPTKTMMASQTCATAGCVWVRGGNHLRA